MLGVIMKRIFGMLMLLPLVLIAQANGQTSENAQAGEQKVEHSPANVQANENTNQPEAHPVYDESTFLDLVMAAQGGGGVSANSQHQPAAFAGIKLGMVVDFGPSKQPPKDKYSYTCTLDLAYDRIQGQSGFSTEVSGMLPIVRFPGPQSDRRKNFIRVYAEPGLGYRAGGDFGGYASAKVMIALFSDKRLNFDDFSPYVEIQHRFPFTAPLRGDSRISIGVMIALCNHCGLE